jgi:hypothetical protein
MANNPRNSPRFIKARSEKELEKRLFLLALSRSIHLVVTTIYPVKDGVVAWFYLDNKPSDFGVSDAARLSKNN